MPTVHSITIAVKDQPDAVQRPSFEYDDSGGPHIHDDGATLTFSLPRPGHPRVRIILPDSEDRYIDMLVAEYKRGTAQSASLPDEDAAYLGRVQHRLFPSRQYEGRSFACDCGGVTPGGPIGLRRRVPDSPPT